MISNRLQNTQSHIVFLHQASSKSNSYKHHSACPSAPMSQRAKQDAEAATTRSRWSPCITAQRISPSTHNRGLETEGQRDRERERERERE